MKVLVTGATGFFGPAIVARLRAAGHDVVAASRSVAEGPSSARLDVASLESCERVMSAVRPEAVVHAAALAHVHPDRVSEDECRRINAGGTMNMAEASARVGVRRFVFISSVMVYGDFDLPEVVRETDPSLAQGVYGESKIAAEQACLARAAAMDVVILRMATMYSPEWLTNIRKRVRPLSSGPPVYFSLDPHGRRYALCSRRNGSEAVLWGVDGRLPPAIYNVADQHTYSQDEIRHAVELVDGPGRTIPVPVFLPRLMWQAVRSVVPFNRWRFNARSRYWKFCESNVYSSAKLHDRGLSLPADLLAPVDKT